MYYLIVADFVLVCLENFQGLQMLFQDLLRLNPTPFSTPHLQFEQHHYGDSQTQLGISNPNHRRWYMGMLNSPSLSPPGIHQCQGARSISSPVAYCCGE
jgi:hypothetical protein